MVDPTLRFSNRVSAYVRTRPSYPAEVLQTLRDEYGLNPSSVIADIGSGTGLSARMFLANGNTVYGVEPNREMREAGENLLSPEFPHFQSMASTAEATGLPRACVDFVTAGQAFHWFDRGKCRVEFARILKPGGWVALMWNERVTDATPFLRDYERMLRQYAPEYEIVDHSKLDSTVLQAWFGGPFRLHTFSNMQHFDHEGLRGRLESSSYAVEASDPNYGPMMQELDRMFHAHSKDGMVDFEYRTKLYCGQLHSA